MEIEQIRKELNHLLENIVDHSSRYSEERPIPSLEISFVLAKLNKMQESLAVLKHLLEAQELSAKHGSSSLNQTIEPEETKEQVLVEAVEAAPAIETTPPIESAEQATASKLTDALTLNDRYLYANELFNKDMNAFNNLVKSIDNSSSMEEAKGLFLAFDWDNENDHVVSFLEMVERSFK